MYIWEDDIRVCTYTQTFVEKKCEFMHALK